MHARLIPAPHPFTSVWIFYIDAIGVWWRTGILSRHIVFWIVFNSSLPLATGWLITFACLSGANLISSRKNEASRHIVGPKTMNSTIGFLFPLSVAGILVTSIRAGQAYERLDNLVLILYKQAAKDSAAYDGSMTALQVEGTKKALAALARTTLVIPFADLTAEYRNWSIVYLVSLSILFTVRTKILTAKCMTAYVISLPGECRWRSIAPLVAPCHGQLSSDLLHSTSGYPTTCYDIGRYPSH